jgi:hypothetical protein
MTSSYEAVPTDARLLLRLLAVQPGPDLDALGAAALRRIDAGTRCVR